MGMKQIGIQVVALNNSGTFYFHPCVAYTNENGEGQLATLTSVEAYATAFVGDSGTIRNLYVQTQSGASPGVGASYVVTVRKNGSDTAVTATLSGTDTQADSSSASDTFAAGDEITISTAVGSGTPSNINASICVEFEYNTDGYSMIHGGSRDSTSAIYAPFGQYGSYNATIYDADAHQIQAPLDFTIRAWYVKVDVAPGAGASRSVRIRRNGSTIVTMTVSESNTEASATGLSVAVSEGDLLGTELVEASGPADAKIRYSVLIESSVNGESWLSGGHGGSWADARIGFKGSGTDGSTAYGWYCGPTGFALRSLYVKGDTIAGTGSRVVTVEKNGSSTALTATVPGNGTVASNTVDEVIYAEGDYADILVDTTNDTEEGQVALAMYISPGTPKGLPILFAG